MPCAIFLGVKEVSYAMKFALAFKGMRDVAMERCFLKSKGSRIWYEI